MTKGYRSFSTPKTFHLWEKVVAISTVADGISHTARFEHVAPFHHEEADAWSVTNGRLKPLGFQQDSLEESVSFQAEIGREMLFQGEKYQVTEFGLQEVFRKTKRMLPIVRQPG